MKAWFRLYTEFVTDPKVQLLAFEDQRHFVALLCLKCNGTLDSEAPNPDFRHRMISKALGLSYDAAEEAQRRLEEVGLINSDWQPRKWSARQFESDTSTERTKSYRERQAMKRHCDVTVTPQIRSDQTQSRPERGAVAPKRATRIPEDFGLTEERRKVAVAESCDPDRTFAAFTDHWHAAAGANARKMDWDATWRNWCRRQINFKPVSRGTTSLNSEALAAYEALIATNGARRDAKVQKALDAVGGWSRIKERTSYEAPKLKAEFCREYVAQTN